MDYKQHLVDCCKQNGIDFNKNFIYAGNRHTYKQRMICRSSPQKRNPEHLFVICYSTDLNLYFAWDLKAPKGDTKENFSANIQNMSIPDKNGIISITKDVEYKGRGTETVLIFGCENVGNFLNKIRGVK